MKKHYLTLLLSAVLIGTGPASAQDREQRIKDRDDMVQVSPQDKEMNAAREKAKETLPEFLSALKSSGSNISEIAFKYPLGGWEHIWVNDVKIDGQYLTGKLNNVPAQDGLGLSQCRGRDAGPLHNPCHIPSN